MEDNRNVKGEEGSMSKVSEHTGKSGNEFMGIDLLISTPESMNDLRIRLDEARKNEAEIMRRANEAHEEVCKLERLIKYFESKTIANDNGAENQNRAVEDNGSESCASGHAQRATGDEKQVYNEPVAYEDMDEDYYKKRRLKFWIYVVVVGILLAAISILVYRHVSDDSEECIEVIYGEGTIKDESSEDENEVESDSLNKGTVQSSGTGRDKQKDKVAEPVEGKAKDVNRSKEEKKTDVSKSMVKEAVPSTYTIQKGETLFGISKKFYGTIDSVNAIVRVNNLKNPNAITYGTTIKLP